MALDGITCELLAHELNNELQGARIDKIFEPDKYTIILHIRSNGSIKKLLISINPSSPRVHFTESPRENPQTPPGFCMLLRKYLSGSKIISITNPGYERILEIHVSTIDELHDTKEIRLVVELMGRYSNAILINSGNKIIDSAIHVDYSISRIREVMPARIYEYPPFQDKMTIKEAYNLIENNQLPIKDEEIHRPLEKALLNSIKGMSPTLCRQIAIQANVDERMSADKLSTADSNSVINICCKLFECILNKDYSPSTYFSEDGRAEEFSPFNYIGYYEASNKDSISQAIDAYYQEKDSSIDLDNKKQRLLTIINNALTHASKKAEIHKADCDEGVKSDIFKKYGDLILSYIYMIKDKTDSVTVNDFYEDPPKDITIPLDPKLNANDNAQEYYKKFRKSKRKYELSSEYLADDMSALEYLRTLKTAAQSASCEDDIQALNYEIEMVISNNKSSKKNTKNNNINPNTTVGLAKSGKASSRALREAAKKANMKNKNNKKEPKALPFRKYLSSDGYQILCGRNNLQNEELTFKVADRNDWWFHVKGLPGTHVILKCRIGEDMPSDDAVIEAAQTAAFFSKSIMIEEHNSIEGSRAGDIKAEIDYCPVSHVKKIPGGKPGMVIYEGYYSIVVSAKEPKTIVNE